MSAPEKGSDASTGAADADTGATTARPVLRVVSGNPTPEEIAVITAVVAAASAGGDGATGPPAPSSSVWGRSSRAPGHRPAPGPGAWRVSGLPR